MRSSPPEHRDEAPRSRRERGASSSARMDPASYDPGAMSTDPYDDDPPALGLVLDADRGSLPYALIHGEALVACAAWALGEAGVSPVDTGVAWATLQEAAQPLVLHDALCPMTPPGFIADCVRRAREADVVVVGVRPVTDTVKVVTAGLVGQTLDREQLVAVVSPVVLPASVTRLLARPPGSDLAALVAALAARFRVEQVPAPAAARRVASAEEVRLLEALTATG